MSYSFKKFATALHTLFFADGIRIAKNKFPEKPNTDQQTILTVRKK
jgi:hypothetical protein